MVGIAWRWSWPEMLARQGTLEACHTARSGIDMAFRLEFGPGNGAFSPFPNGRTARWRAGELGRGRYLRRQLHPRPGAHLPLRDMPAVSFRALLPPRSRDSLTRCLQAFTNLS